MLILAIILVFISAILHVSWNVILQSTDDPLDFGTKAVSLGTAVLLPFIFFFWLFSHSQAISSYAIFFALLSGLAELGYFMFLSYSYRHGEMSIVYPVARGSAPILSVLAGLFILRESTNQEQLIGILFLIAGIWLVRRAKILGKGFIPALLTGVFIASYTIIDKVGLHYANPIIFGGLKFFFTALCLLLWLPIRKKYNIHSISASEKQKNTPWKKIALVGVIIITTYQLVLFALSLSSVAIISPLRESASVVVTVWGIWKLKEREGIFFKIAGVILIFSGIVLLAI